MRNETSFLVISLASLLWFGAGLRVVAEEPAAESAGQRWAVVIGVNEYLDPAIPNLKYCVSDAYRVFEALTEHGGFEADRVLLITDDQQRGHLRPLRVNFERQIGDWLSHARPEDTVFVYFSGHGFVEELSGEGFLGPSDCFVSDLRTTGFPTARLRQMLRDCPARQKLLVLDCCFAGAVRSGLPSGASAEELGQAFEESRGLITLASSRKDQWSYECDERESGLFTYYLARGLSGQADYDRDGVVNVDELYRYTFEQVPRVAQRERNARQHPVRIIGSDTEGVFAVSRVSVIPELVKESVTVTFTVRCESDSGRAIVGALVELYRGEDAGESMERLGSGRSDTEGRLSLEVALDSEAPALVTYEARVRMGSSRRSYRLEGFPRTRHFRVYLPNEPPALAMAPFDAKEARVHQESWAEHLGLAVEIENSVGMQLRLIPPGEFMMGSPESEEGRVDREGPQHRVRITRPFYLGVYPVTQSQWASVMGTTPSAFSSDGRYSDRVSGLSTGDFPVESVSWEDAQEFIGRLNERSEETGRVYRLPTEAEWEYACRAGTTTRYYFGDDEAELDEYGWYSGNTGGWGEGRTHRVGQQRPNAWGLYDLHGNVWEWCSDWFSEDYYVNSPLEDPTGPESGSLRVLRGGSWFDSARGCRSALRYGLGPGSRIYFLGFRVAFSSVE